MAKNKFRKQATVGNSQSVVGSQQPTKNQTQPADNQALSSTITFSPLVVVGTLVVAIFACYFPVWQNDFVWDDKPYILTNQAIRDSSIKGIAHIFSYFEQGNYHPLTMLSYMIEYKLVGDKTWLYHLDNLLLHIANSYLVFTVLKRLTANDFVAYITALLFAVHPMHVESVAWAAERKDMLYVLFLLFSFLNYLKYDETRQNKYYLLSCALFLASILSKGMAVVLPALLVITDYCFLRKPLSIKLLYNKIPYFILTIIFAYIATTAQKTAGADASAVINANYSGIDRVFMASYAFCFYWLKTILPFGLLGFYPYPTKVNNGLPIEYYLALAGVLLLLGGIYWFGKKDRRIWWAGLFFLIAISTVLQILPIGSAIVADRYYYLSSIGPLFLIALIINQLKEKNSSILMIMGVVGLVLCALTFRQTTLWKNQLTLFTPIVDKYPTDGMALSNMGWYYVDKKEFPTAKQYFNKAIENGLKGADLFRTLGSMYLDEGDPKMALQYYQKAIEIPPVEDRTYWLAALAAGKASRFDDAQNYYAKVKNLNDISPAELTMLGSSFGAMGRFEEAKTLMKKAIQAKPDFWDAHLNYAFTFRQEKNLPEEIKLLEELIKKAPDYLPAYKNIGVSLVEIGQWQKATDYWKKAAVLEPNGSYEYNIGIAYATHNDLETAKSWYIKSAKKGDANAKDILSKNGVNY